MNTSQKNFKKGQAIAEYLILTALIAIASIAVLQLLSTNIRSKIAVVSDALIGKDSSRRGRESREKHFEVIDMGTFSNGMEDSKK